MPRLIPQSYSRQKPHERLRRPWSETDLSRLVEFAQRNHSSVDIAHALKRTPKAVRNMASQLGIQLKWRVVQSELAAAKEGELSPRKELAKMRRGAWKIAADCDFSELTYAQRRALAERLLASIPPDNPDLVVSRPRDPQAKARARFARRTKSVRKWLEGHRVNKAKELETLRRKEPEVAAAIEAQWAEERRYHEQRAAKLAEAERRIDALSRGEGGDRGDGGDGGNEEIDLEKLDGWDDLA